MSATALLEALEANSLRLSSVKRMVRLDDATNPEVEQTYLTVEGSPDAFRWLAAQLTQMANSAAKHDAGTSVIVSPRDLSQVTMTDWDSLELACKQDEDSP